MAHTDEHHVVTDEVIVVWDGITNPEQKQSGGVKHNVRVLVHPQAPSYTEMYNLANNVLQTGIFRGTLPPKGNWPFAEADHVKLGEEFRGWIAFSATTSNGAPEVLDANGRILNAIEMNKYLYPGAKAKLIVHAYDYDNVQKGIGMGLDGIMIVDNTAPKLAVAGGMSTDAARSAFGVSTPAAGAAPGAAPGSAPAPGAAPGPAPGSAPAPAPGAAPGSAPAPGAAPTPDAPPAAGFSDGHVMTAKAGGVTYDAFIAKGWTDDALRQHGYMQ